jgi:hypothetical protein
MALHGPHHGAQQSMTRAALFVVVVSKSASVIVIGVLTLPHLQVV